MNRRFTLYPLKKFTTKDALARTVDLFPDNLAFTFIEGAGYTYRQFNAKVQEISAQLQAQGIGHGDKVAILGENMPNWPVAYFAITTIGAVAVPILTEFHASAIHHILRHSEAKGLFVSEKLSIKLEDGHVPNLKFSFLLDTLTLFDSTQNPLGAGHIDPLSHAFQAALREFESLKGKTLQKNKDKDEDEETISNEKYALALMTKNDSETLKEQFARALKTGFKELEKWKGQVKTSMGIKTTVNEDDLLCIIYTSGTTGNSKGVMLTHKNVVSNAYATILLGELTDKERILSILPLPHTYEGTLGMVIPVVSGIAVYYLKKPPTPSVLLPALAKVRPTFMLSVPLVLEKIYKNKILPNFTRSKVLSFLYKKPFFRKKLNAIAGKKLIETFGGELRCCCIGGAPLSPEVELFLREGKFPYNIGYGLTETSPMVAATMPFLTKFKGVGPVLAGGVQMKINMPDPQTGEGEVFVKGPNVMLGYYKAPEITKEVFTTDGWFKTGDLGFIDEDGFLFIRGRLKNMILGPSGENIYPEEIEAIISEFPHVMESLCYEQSGKIVVLVHFNYEQLDEAFNLNKNTENQTRELVAKHLDELKKFVNSKTSSFINVHKIMEQTEPFEKTPTLKIKRYLYITK